MNISGVGAAAYSSYASPAASAAPVGGIDVMRTANAASAEQALKLIEVTMEMAATLEKMDVAGQIIDTYA